MNDGLQWPGRRDDPLGGDRKRKALYRGGGGRLYRVRYTGTRRLHLPHVEVTMSEPLGSFPRARGIGWEGTRVEGGDPVSSQC